MTDQTVVHIGENSPERIAYLLLYEIANVEGKSISQGGGVDRKWILDTYAECINVVRNPVGRTPSRVR
jgi:hypothetical protein